MLSEAESGMYRKEKQGDLSPDSPVFFSVLHEPAVTL